MTTENEETLAEALFQELVTVVNKHASKVSFEDTVAVLQSIVVSLACSSTPSREEASEFLHELVDECLEVVDDEECDGVEIEE